MNPRPIEEARSPLIALALPALKRARRRAEEIARGTHTALVFAEGNRVVVVWPDGSSPQPSERHAKA